MNQYKSPYCGSLQLQSWSYGIKLTLISQLKTDKIAETILRYLWDIEAL